jgi:hypothetical protein
MIFRDQINITASELARNARLSAVAVARADLG